MSRTNQALENVTVDTSVAICDEIPFYNDITGEIVVPTGSSITLITWHVAEKEGGTFVPAQTEAGVAVTQTVGAGKAYPIPAALMGAQVLKAQGNASGTIHVSTKA